MRIDLHTHSSASDGTQPPGEVMAAAAAAGLDVVALTDHDSTAGWDEAAGAAVEAGVTLVRGIEISTRFRRSGVHLLAYLPSGDDVPLMTELARVVEGREARVPGMLARLRELGIPATEEALAEITGDTAATGRPHVADLLVRLGAVRDRAEAFDRFLGHLEANGVDFTRAEVVVGPWLEVDPEREQFVGTGPKAPESPEEAQALGLLLTALLVVVAGAILRRWWRNRPAP